jgi:hypothetical protein
MERVLRLESGFARWWVSQAVASATRVRPPVDAVVATMSPFASAEAAEAISRNAGVPWVADLRDPWALDEMQTYPSALHRRLEVATMGRRLRPAAAIVMNTPEAADRVRSTFPELARRRIVAIPNGFDRADFDEELPPRSDGAFRIVHAGFLHTELGSEDGRVRRLLGGSEHGVERHARSLVYLCDALRRLHEEAPSVAERVELHVAGVLTDADRGVLHGGAVREHGYLPHRRAVELMRSADLLFLPMHDLPPGRRATIVPGKTYEYLATGRPILAAVPDGDARDLLAQAPNAHLCRPTASAAMKDVIVDLLGQREQPDTPGVPDDVLSLYERRNLTGDLATLLDDVLGSPPSAKVGPASSSGPAATGG